MHTLTKEKQQQPPTGFFLSRKVQNETPFPLQNSREQESAHTSLEIRVKCLG